MKRDKRNKVIVHVDSIPALKNSYLSSQEKKDLQEHYNAILFYDLDIPEPPNKTIVTDEFIEGFLHQSGAGAERFDFVRLFKTVDPKNGNVGIEIIPDHLDQLNMSFDDAYKIALNFIYLPVVSPKLDLCCSVYSNKNLFFHIHQHELGGHLTGFSYEPSKQAGKKASYGKCNEPRHQTDHINICILPSGVVLMYV